jgi:hypothetical protein
MFVLDGRPLVLDVPFTGPNGTQYPANWLRCATPEERLAVGITEVQEPLYYDQRFYWGYDQDGNLIPKEHSQLVKLWSNQTRTTANTLLFPTDWMIIREVDNGNPCPANMKTWREDIRLSANQKVVDIESTTTTEELAVYVTSSDYSTWPQQPSGDAE